MTDPLLQALAMGVLVALLAFELVVAMTSLLGLAPGRADRPSIVPAHATFA